MHNLCVLNTVVAMNMIWVVGCSSTEKHNSPIFPSPVSIREKAIHAFISKHYADARELAEKALAMSNGQDDNQSHLLLAILDFRDCMIDSALSHLSFADDKAMAEFPLADQLDEVKRAIGRFGTIEILPSDSVVKTTRIVIEPTNGVIGEENKRCMDMLSKIFSKPVNLPYKVVVPAGEYRINYGNPFVVLPSGHVRVLDREVEVPR